MGNCQTQCCQAQQIDQQNNEQETKEYNQVSRPIEYQNSNLPQYDTEQEQQIVKIQAQVRGNLVRQAQTQNQSNKDISTGLSTSKNQTPLLYSVYFKESLKAKDESDQKKIEESQIKTVSLDQIELQNGTFYKGDWFRRQKHGKGELIFGDAVYSGEWHENQASGHGKLEHTKKNGQKEIYEGQWKNDKANGKGKYSSKLFEYNGDWVDDHYEGEGVLEIFGITKYTGGFKMGMRHGKGVLEFLSQNIRYDGEWAYGQGQYQQNGIIYKGTWQENKMNGSFIIQYSDNIVFDGKYQDDIKEGKFQLKKGKQTWNGVYIKGQINGEVVVKTGLQEKVSIWNDGKFVKWQDQLQNRA